MKFLFLLVCLPLFLFSECPQVQNLHFNEKNFELQWDDPVKPGRVYLIFGSNSDEDHFLGETTTNSFPVDGRFTHYCIIATQAGELSLSSPFIYVKGPCVSDEIWQQVLPYLLPENHPAKAALDRIFSKKGLLKSKKDLKKAGFKLVKHDQNEMVIAKHEELKGYVIKAYLNSSPATDWALWRRRIQGAQLIQKSLDQHGYNHLMKVPKKWIYPLPVQDELGGKNFILVAENMKILKGDENLLAFKEQMTPQMLDALYIVIKENLLIDSIYADNIPFSKDGRIAFIDTEHFNDTTQPLKLYRLAQFLSKKMHAYWDQLLINGGPHH